MHPETDTERAVMRHTIKLLHEKSVFILIPPDN